MYRDLIASFTLMDNVYMAKFFEGQTACVEELLRAVLDMPDLRVTKFEVEHEVANVLAHSARLDVLAEDSDGRLYDIEIQHDLKRATPRRARFYLSLLDTASLDKSADYKQLPETRVIFITEGDALKLGQPLYTVGHTVLETGDRVETGQRMIFVDATYNFGDGALADVMHDFTCADPDQMRCPAFAARARYLKRTTEGERDMLTTSEIIFNEGLEKGMAQGIAQGVEKGTESVRREAIAKLVASGCPKSQIAAAFGITEADVERYANATPDAGPCPYSA